MLFGVTLSPERPKTRRTRQQRWSALSWAADAVRLVIEFIVTDQCRKSGATKELGLTWLISFDNGLFYLVRLALLKTLLKSSRQARRGTRSNTNPDWTSKFSRGWEVTQIAVKKYTCRSDNQRPWSNTARSRCHQSGLTSLKTNLHLKRLRKSSDKRERFSKWRYRIIMDRIWSKNPVLWCLSSKRHERTKTYLLKFRERLRLASDETTM